MPDHATIAFVARHEQALAELFGDVLRLCGEAGLVKPEVIAIDGTRMAGSANSDATRDFEQLAKEILAEHKATDEAEDERYGDARGDELPEELQTVEGRREFFRKARQRLRHEQTEGPEPADEGSVGPELVFDEERIVARTQGREGWLREARRQLERSLAEAGSIARRRAERLCSRRTGSSRTWPRSAVGTRRMSSSSSGAAPPVGFGLAARRALPASPGAGWEGQHDRSRQQALEGPRGVRPGLQRPSVVVESQIVLAAEVTNDNTDWSQLDPMVTATISELERAGIADQPETALADAQYWNESTSTR